VHGCLPCLNSKTGVKTYPDIVIMHRNEPWVVIELKESSRAKQLTAGQEREKIQHQRETSAAKRGYFLCLARWGKHRTMRELKGPFGFWFYEVPVTLERGGMPTEQFASPSKIGRLPLSYTTYRDEVQQASVAAGFGKVGTHSFRHSFRSWLDATGAEITVQRESMRHSDIRMTLNTYGRVVSEAQKLAGSRVVDLVMTDSKVIPSPVTHLSVPRHR
jgi:hypothetical protein